MIPLGGFVENCIPIGLATGLVRVSVAGADAPGWISSDDGDTVAEASACTATVAVASTRPREPGGPPARSRAVSVAEDPWAGTGTVTANRTVTLLPAATVTGAGPASRTCQPAGAASVYRAPEIA